MDDKDERGSPIMERSKKWRKKKERKPWRNNSERSIHKIWVTERVWKGSKRNRKGRREDPWANESYKPLN